MLGPGAAGEGRRSGAWGLGARASVLRGSLLWGRAEYCAKQGGGPRYGGQVDHGRDSRTTARGHPTPAGAGSFAHRVRTVIENPDRTERTRSGEMSSRWPALGMAVAAMALTAAAPAAAAEPAVTRAALDPALSPGAAPTSASSSRRRRTRRPTAPSSGRTARRTRCRPRLRAVRRSSSRPGSMSSSRCPHAANAITVRYSIPDAPNGGGITAPLDVTVNGKTTARR